ncbi:MAG: D-alanyl-D-alanine carboxypeptidase [Ruminococcaceae bacterium]|nr:D-alanyl-D-alanine carboxypeptidase [Oscillospiraceae bacterium]
MEYDADDLNVPLEAVATVGEIGQTLDIKAKSCILMEAKTGKILYEDNADEVTAPASITKIMSLVLIMEALDDGRLTLETVVTASEHAAKMGGSQIWLEPNEQMTVNDLLKAAVIASANDATVALAEAVSGSEETFVEEMNKKAKAIGMNSTTFINCTGLDAEGHTTTAHDVALMSRELITHELIKQYSTVWMDSLRNGESELVNTNKLVRFYEGCTGLKTGTTSKAGYCLSATAKRNGMELVAVIMDGQTSSDRFEGAKKLLNYGFANYTFSSLDADLKENTSVAVKNGTESAVAVRAGGKLDLLLKRNENGKITQEISIEPEIIAPVKAGQKVGTVIFLLDGKELGSVDIVAEKDVRKLNFSTVFLRLILCLFKL